MCETCDLVTKITDDDNPNNNRVRVTAAVAATTRLKDNYNTYLVSDCMYELVLITIITAVPKTNNRLYCKTDCTVRGICACIVVKVEVIKSVLVTFTLVSMHKLFWLLIIIWLLFWISW